MKLRSKLLVACIAIVFICSIARTEDAGMNPVKRQAVPQTIAPGIYVSPSGNDGNPGTYDAPLASLAEAARRVSQGEAATVWLRDGIYAVDQTLSLGKEHSGPEGGRLVVRAVNPGKAVLDGGTASKAAEFDPVTDQETLARIQPEARAHIRKLDLKARGFVNTRVFPAIFGGRAPLPLFELYFQGKRMTISRYPKAGWLTVKRILNNGGGATPVFEFRDPHHARCLGAVESGLWLRGYWRVEWQFDAIKVKAIDPEARTVEFAHTPGGGLGCKYIRPEEVVQSLSC